MPMSAAFSAGRVVDAVAGHRDDVAVGLQRVDDAQLVRRAPRARRPRSCAPPRRSRRRPARRARRPVSAGAPASHDAEVGGDARGRARMVAGDHDHADAGAPRLADRHRRLLARRVDDADRADEDQVALQRVRSACAVLVRRQRAVGDRQRAQRRVRQRVDVGQEPRAPARRRARPPPCPTRTRVQRSSSTSGAPLVITHQLVAVLVVDARSSTSSCARR